MQKYSFLVYHREYESFLKNVQDLGVLHVIEKNLEPSEAILEKVQLTKKIEKAIKFLEKREVEREKDLHDFDGQAIYKDVIGKQEETENLKQLLAEKNKEVGKVKPWGDFSPQLIQQLDENGLKVRFFIGSKRQFDQGWLDQYYAEVIKETDNSVYFIVIQRNGEEIDIEAEEIKMPSRSGLQVDQEIHEIQERLDKIEEEFDHYAKTAIPSLKKAKAALMEQSEYDLTFYHTATEAEDKVMVLEGWVPGTAKKRINDFLTENNIVYISAKPKIEEQVPVLLKNNRFSRLFEPIGNLFSLPSYQEIDLTVFFAPFFMMFFGFCLGDAGYGLLFIFGAGVYKRKAKKDVKPYLTLIQLLGLATLVFGTLSGTFFGIDLIAADFKILERFKGVFLNPDNMFNLALILGAVQIIFGMSVKMANKIVQFGFVYALSTMGWLIILLGITIYAVLTGTGVIGPSDTLLYVILCAGGFFILFFSDPDVNVFARVGKGLWDVYSTVTGIFGDLLSYIRLFALGLSSAILGFVINDIALQILGSAPVIGHIFFVVFLILGHTLNILISSLGSFVHPMRLTFVEFYKNAGFAGGGKEYKPFSRRI